MRRKRTDPPKLDASELPELTDQQRAFVEGLLVGKTATDAYRAAYDCSTMAQSTIWSRASELRSNSKVAVWIAAAQKAELGHSQWTLDQYIRKLDRAAVLCEETGNLGAHVQALNIIGKALGHHVERMDLNINNTDDLLSQIRELAPELAERLEATEH